jgi:antitoxin component of MazEF toxin-antitoxin module
MSEKNFNQRSLICSATKNFNFEGDFKMKNVHYQSTGSTINIPIAVFEDAGLPLGGDISVLVSDGMFVIAATTAERQTDLTDAFSCLMEELGYDPDHVETISSALPYERR